MNAYILNFLTYHSICHLDEYNIDFMGIPYGVSGIQKTLLYAKKISGQKSPD